MIQIRMFYLFFQEMNSISLLAAMRESTFVNVVMTILVSRSVELNSLAIVTARYLIGPQMPGLLLI
jgi:hypothetical protein